MPTPSAVRAQVGGAAGEPAAPAAGVVGPLVRRREPKETTRWVSAHDEGGAMHTRTEPSGATPSTAERPRRWARCCRPATTARRAAAALHLPGAVACGSHHRRAREAGAPPGAARRGPRARDDDRASELLWSWRSPRLRCGFPSRRAPGPVGEARFVDRQVRAASAWPQRAPRRPRRSTLRQPAPPRDAAPGAGRGSWSVPPARSRCTRPPDHSPHRLRARRGARR